MQYMRNIKLMQVTDKAVLSDPVTLLTKVSKWTAPFEAAAIHW